MKLVKQISKKNYIYNKIINLKNTFVKTLGIKDPKFIIMGLNPHAGENGKIGKEEVKIIKPTIKKLKNKNINIEGPYSADSIFSNSNIKNYDCFISHYHDQALIPFKQMNKLKKT